MRLVVVTYILLSSIISFSQSFNIEWQGCFGGSDTDTPYDMIQVSDGYLIAGGTESINGDISFNNGATDGWLMKIDFEGNLIWEKNYGGSLGDGIFRIFPADDNNFYLLCQANSSDGDISNDPYPDSGDFWIIKIDESGEIIWDKIFGGNGGEQMWTGYLANDGGIIACGWTASNDGDVSNYYGLFDGWMIKVNSNGEKEWDFTIGTDGQDVCQAVLQTSDGGYLLGCASIILDVGNITCEPFNYLADAVLVKLDSNLNIEWDRCYGGSDHDGIWDIIEIGEGYVFMGYASSNDGDISGWHGEGDIWIVKTDFDGNIVWQKCLGGSRFESASKFYQTPENGYIIAGRTESIDGDVTGNHTISEYDNDIWIVKLNSEGELLWEQCFGGIWDEQVNFGFIDKGNNNFVIAGHTDYGPSFDVGCLPHGGLYDRDFWVFEVKDTLVGVQINKAIELGLKVYPNPANDYVVFEYQYEASNFVIAINNQIIVTNLFGQQVAVLSVKKEKTVWDIRTYSNGVYFYSSFTNGILESGKIIIRR